MLNKNLAIANRSRVSCAHNTSVASISLITVTLKSRLRVIRGQWKRNHWIDHARLTGQTVYDYLLVRHYNYILYYSRVI